MSAAMVACGSPVAIAGSGASRTSAARNSASSASRRCAAPSAWRSFSTSAQAAPEAASVTLLQPAVCFHTAAAAGCARWISASMVATERPSVMPARSARSRVDVGRQRARLGRELAASGDAVADIGGRKSDGGKQRHAECDQPDRPGGRGRHHVAVAPELGGRARQHDGEEIDGEPDRGEEHRGFGGLAERGRKARVDGEPDDREPDRREPEDEPEEDAAGAAAGRGAVEDRARMVARGRWLGGARTGAGRHGGDGAGNVAATEMGAGLASGQAHAHHRGATKPQSLDRPPRGQFCSRHPRP